MVIPEKMKGINPAALRLGINTKNFVGWELELTPFLGYMSHKQNSPQTIMSMWVIQAQIQINQNLN